MSPRTGTAYKADGPDEVAQDTEVHGSGAEVDAGVVQLQFAFLSGETPEAPRHSLAQASGWQADRGVSRGHSTPQARGREQYRSTRANEAANMESWCPEHAATVDRSSLPRAVGRGMTTGTARCGPACRVVWEPGLALRVSHRPPDSPLQECFTNSVRMAPKIQHTPDDGEIIFKRVVYRVGESFRQEAMVTKDFGMNAGVECEGIYVGKQRVEKVCTNPFCLHLTKTNAQREGLPQPTRDS